MSDQSMTRSETLHLMQHRVPKGIISMWYGSIASVPNGWALCNGDNGTPDLRNQFVVGAGDTYAVAGTGGATTHTHTVNATETTDVARGATLEDPQASRQSHTHATASSSSLPPYYALAYVMKL
jgi:hypothetical protein